jgi:hypothetical protein
MRMPAEIALPGVQHGGDGELGAKPFWVAAEVVPVRHGVKWRSGGAHGISGGCDDRGRDCW